MKPLDPFAVDFTGVHLIEASAGTGKTYNIASLYVRALIEAGQTVDEILVVTYTEAATKELRDRLMRRLRESIRVLEGGVAGSDSFLSQLKQQIRDPEKVDGGGETDDLADSEKEGDPAYSQTAGDTAQPVDSAEAAKRLKRAVRSFDEAAIYTIHGFCRHALQDRAFESGAPFEAELIGDDSEIVREIIEDYWRNYVQEASKDELKRPLLQFLLDKGLNPESLTEELAGYVGKPYMRLRPEGVPPMEGFEEEISTLTDLYDQMETMWESDRSELQSLLLGDAVSGRKYRTDWLQSWMQAMDEWLESDVTPIVVFDKFERFAQSYIDESLTKKSREKRMPPPAHPFFKAVDEYMETSASLQQLDVAFRRKLFTHLTAALDEKKEELQVYSYDDLLIQLRNALYDSERGPRLRKSLRRTYPLALVDEFQDTDPIQYQIFNAIYGRSREGELRNLEGGQVLDPDQGELINPKQRGLFSSEDASGPNSVDDGPDNLAGKRRPGSEHGALFMIGDPKQSIYSFRGADIFSYLEAQKGTPAAHTYSLGHNYRSSPALIAAVNTLFGSHANPFILNNISYEPVKAGLESTDQLRIGGLEEAPLEIRQLGGFGKDESSDNKPKGKGDAQDISARDTAAKIHALLSKSQKGEAKIGGNAVQAGDIAVLVRSHNQAELMREALMEKSIKSVTHSRQSVFRSAEARQLYTLLKAVLEPAREQGVATALSTVILGYTADELMDLQEDENQWAALLERFNNWHDMWQEHGFTYMFRTIMREQSVAEIVVQLKNGERMLTNLNHLGELMGQEEQDANAGMHTLLKWLLRKREKEKQTAQKDNEEEQLRLESDENLVSVVTMHHSKGLEYPVVFCPFLWHSPRNSDFGKPLVYHDRENASEVYLDMQGKEDPDRSEKRYQQATEELAEGVRLAYVAITRAKYKCVINWVFAKKSAHSSLGYLLLGNEESLKSLEASIYSGKKYEDNESLFKTAISYLADHETISASAVYELETEMGAVSDRDEPLKMEARTFSRNLPLPKGAGMSSFSSLVRSEHADFEADYRRYYDDFYEQQEPDKIKAGEAEAPSLSVFNFPKGPDPGTAVHQMFENIDFNDSSGREAVIREELRRQDIDERWVPIARNMLSQTLNKSLPYSTSGTSGRTGAAGGEEAVLKLNAIQPVDMIHEMEFYFSTGQVQLRELLAIIRPDDNVPYTVEGYAAKGFLKGFIDLIFRHGDRFYILDYKTNHLGHTVEDYEQYRLTEEMKEKMYDLQYHIYLVALHRFLRRRLPDYHFDRHMGGAFYLFLRGINEEGAEGIYYDRPDVRLIDTLDTELGRDAR
jgi:exodeoxyribonuclease V beta subunit